MFKRFRRFGERLATFTEWVRVYPHILTRKGRESIMDDLLTLAGCAENCLEEMVSYAERVMELKAMKSIRFVASEEGTVDLRKMPQGAVRATDIPSDSDDLHVIDGPTVSRKPGNGCPTPPPRKMNEPAMKIFVDD